MGNHITSGMKPETFDLWGEMVELIHERLQQEQPERNRILLAVRIQNKERRHQHRGIYRAAYAKSAADYLARKTALPNTFTKAQWEMCLDYWQYTCAACGRKALDGYILSQDHWIPLTSPRCPGTIITNILPLCCGVDGCNNHKQSKSPDVWLVRRFGYGRGEEIKERIAAYFAWATKELETP